MTNIIEIHEFCKMIWATILCFELVVVNICELYIYGVSYYTTYRMKSFIMVWIKDLSQYKKVMIKLKNFLMDKSL